MSNITIQKFGHPVPQDNPPRAVWRALLRGARQSCPQCAKGNLYSSYLKVVKDCANCGEAMHHHRADDAPPYFTILLVGHIVVPLLVIVEKVYRPDLWLHTVLWLPLAVVLALVLLPVVKGALVGLQWALYMHGFDPNHDDGYVEFGTDWDGTDTRSH